MQNEERQKNELKKQKEYDSDVFYRQNKENQTNYNVQEEKLEMIKYKESFFKKILKKIRTLF